ISTTLFLLELISFLNCSMRWSKAPPRFFNNSPVASCPANSFSNFFASTPSFKDATSFCLEPHPKTAPRKDPIQTTRATGRSQSQTAAPFSQFQIESITQSCSFQKDAGPPS